MLQQELKQANQQITDMDEVIKDTWKKLKENIRAKR